MLISTFPTFREVLDDILPLNEEYGLITHELEAGKKRLHSDALPAGKQGRGDHRRGDGRSSVGGFRRSGESTSCPKRHYGRACELNSASF